MSGNAISIGTFDGVHHGHVALVQRCRTFAKANRGKAIILAFDPHPVTQLAPQAAPARLVTWDRKRALLIENGADEVVRLSPTPDLLSKTGDQFLAWVWDQFNPGLIVEGSDFHYGKGRDGTIATLCKFATAKSAQVQVVEGIEVALGDHQIVRASSSLVRWLVGHGRVGDAERVLGRWFELEGTVVQGDRKGRTIGVPTCNLSTECMLPLDGVYAGRAILRTGEQFAAVVAVGARPTVSGAQRRAEVHVLRETSRVSDVGAGGGVTAGVMQAGLQAGSQAWSLLPGVPEYGWPLRVQLHSFVRDEVKFPSWNHLKEQIDRDLQRVRELTRV